MGNLLKVGGDIKSDHTINLLGYEKYKDIKNKYLPYLQKTADNRYGVGKFDINNFDRKKFEIHHKVPCNKFNLKCSYHQKLCFNWENTEILSIKDHKEVHKLEIYNKRMKLCQE